MLTIEEPDVDLILDFERSERDERLRHTAKLGLKGLARELQREGVYFEFEPGRSVPEPLVLDGFMFCFLHLAMERARRFVIRGPVSARALRNAQTYQEAWHCWLPGRYRVVEILPDRIVPERKFAPRRRGRAIAAFSGGLDSTFTILRHSQKRAGFHDLSFVLTIHGFDVRLDNQQGFDRLVRRTDPLLHALGLERRTLRTNIRQREVQNWEQSFGTQTACALHQFSDEFDYGLFAGSLPYTHQLNAWGSAAATDYLLSGDDLEIVHEGSGFCRTEKTELVAAHPVARRVVKVCWEGEDQDRNCGVCEKCVRTRLNFLAAGDENPPCFDSPFDIAMIETIEVRSVGALTGLFTLLAHVDQRNIRAPWVDAVRARADKAAADLGSRPASRKPSPAGGLIGHIRKGFPHFGRFQ